MEVKLLQIDGNSYNYLITKRRNSRYLRLRIDSAGLLKVSIPYYSSSKSGVNFIIRNKEWIDKKISALNIQKNFYYLGKEIKLIKKINLKINKINFTYLNNILYIELSNSNLLSDQELYNIWLKNKAERYFHQKVERLASIYGFQYNSIRIRNMKSRWGSCSPKKNLCFNLKLMSFNSKIIEYVIIHELCHLKFMNHSKNYWNLVESIQPDFRIYRNELTKIIL